MNLRTTVTTLGLSVAFVALIFLPGMSAIPPTHTPTAAAEPSTATTLTNPTTGTSWGVMITAFSSTDMGANKPFLYNALQQTGQYPRGHLKVLYGANATKQNILAAFAWLASVAKPTDNVVISDNSHGYYLSGVSGIVPVDYQKNGLISVQELASHLNTIHPKEMFLLMDCCFAGNFVSGIQPLKANTLLSQGLEGPNRVVLMSTLRNGLGIGITVHDSQGEQYLSFTRYVAEGITKHYDPNHDGIISAEEAYHYARNRWMPLALYYTLSKQWQAKTHQESGYYALPLPKIYDTTQGTFPLAPS